MEIKEYAELSNKILNYSTQYLNDKKIISKFFIPLEEQLSKELIKTRLTVIDSYYSTNMGKRYFGIDEIAENILSLSKNDNELKERFQNYAKNPKTDKHLTGQLFDEKYGIRKSGIVWGKAISLLSKYAYFLTNLEFPIFDTIVREVYPKIMRYCCNGRRYGISDNNFDKFVTKINILKEEAKISSYDKLDNLLWLVGKILRGNYSLILGKTKYCKLVNQIPNVESLRSKELDTKIKELIESKLNKLSDIFSEDLKTIIKFSYEIDQS